MTEPGPLVLVVEDEPQMRKFLLASLASHGYRMLETDSVGEAIRLLTANPPDLVLLDLGLPDGDGIELTKTIRGWTSVPIIIISARGREDDKVDALDAGADDYLTKPFGVRELQARIRVALRHAAQVTGESAAPEIVVDTLKIDLPRHQVFVGDREVHLTPIEYKLLVLLARNAGKVLTHRAILKEIWGPGQTHQSHYVRVHMAELRKKVELDPARPRLLVTEPGVGYRFREPS